MPAASNKGAQSTPRARQAASASRTNTMAMLARSAGGMRALVLGGVSVGIGRF
jgi:hypothetical protein